MPVKGALLQGALLIALILGVIYLIAPFLLGLIFCVLFGVAAYYIWKSMQYAGITRFLEDKLSNLSKVAEVYLQYKAVFIYATRDHAGIKAYVTYCGLTTVHRGSVPEVTARIMDRIREMEVDQASKSKSNW